MIPEEILRKQLDACPGYRKQDKYGDWNPRCLSCGHAHWGDKLVADKKPLICGLYESAVGGEYYSRTGANKVCRAWVRKDS